MTKQNHARSEQTEKQNSTQSANDVSNAPTNAAPPPKMTCGTTESVWFANGLRMPAFSTLAANQTADVCIIGGGIAGLTTAYFLLKEGKSVVILEAGELASGETGRTTAHLANAWDDGFVDAEKAHGLDVVRVLVASHGTAIDTMEQIARENHIDCDFKRLDAYLFVGEGQTQADLLAEMDAAARAGMIVERAECAPVKSFDSKVAIRFANQARMHAIKYMRGLAGAIARNSSAKIFTNTSACDIADGRQVKVKTQNGFTVTCSAAVVATATPINKKITIHDKMSAFRTYALGLTLEKVDAMSDILLWDTADPYHYIRWQGDVLIVGGEDHRVGQGDPEGSFRKLEQWARKRFPIKSVAFRWSGEYFDPADGIAFIGKSPGEKNVYIVTGDSGQGTTHGTLAGILLTDLIVGRPNPWAKIYDPSRKMTAAAAEWIKGNANIAAQYMDYVKPAQTLDELALGDGIVEREGGRLIAIYRDVDGTLHRCSAACPHAAAIVRWNPVEKSWDCPAHGSRFDKNGKVICGPAWGDLEPA